MSAAGPPGEGEAGGPLQKPLADKRPWRRKRPARVLPAARPVPPFLSAASALRLWLLHGSGQGGRAPHSTRKDASLRGVKKGAPGPSAFGSSRAGFSPPPNHVPKEPQNLNNKAILLYLFTVCVFQASSLVGFLQYLKTLAAGRAKRHFARGKG